MRRHLPSLLLLTAIVTSSTVALTGGASSPVAAAKPADTQLSIVQLGDSIASGEGTLYQAPNPQKPNGQLYFCKSTSEPSQCHSYVSSYNGYWQNWPSFSPGTWTPSASPTYPECHQSPDSYGNIVAAAHRAKFTQIACTGASYLAGITGSEEFKQGSLYPSAFLAPYTVGAPKVKSGAAASVAAQFGNISSTGVPSKVNSVYTSAKPNVVLLTLGADDLRFVDILTACIGWNYTPAAKQFAIALPSSTGIGYSGDLQCSDDNPTDKKGPTGKGYPNGVIQDYYTNQLGILHTHLTNLLTAIEKEGQQSGQSGPPKIVITNYPNPLPKNLPQKSGGDWATDYCPDTFPLYNAQVDYFSKLVDQLNTDMVGWVGDYQKNSKFGANVGFVDLAKMDEGHQWCDDQNGQLSPRTDNLVYRQPYAYGFSVNGTSTSLARYPAPAIFHPTITAQEQIAACVKPVVSDLLSNNSSSARSRSARLEARDKQRTSTTVNGKQVVGSC